MIKNFIWNIFHKEKKKAKPSHVVISKSKHGIDLRLVSKSALRVIQTLEDAGHEAYLVGGAVRDLLLGVEPKDFDVATSAKPEQVRRLFRRAFLIGRRFQIVHVLFGQELIEVTTFRGTNLKSALKDQSGRILSDNTFGSHEEDAERRDFTVNALYYSPTKEELHDFHGGLTDLKEGVLRIIGKPEERYREDPVRMLRVVRFAAKLGFKIDPATQKPISALSHLLENVPAARLFDETLKFLMSGQALTCLEELRKEKLDKKLLPLFDLEMQQEKAAHFIRLALQKTDERIRKDLSVSPGFLFASLLWPEVHELWEKLKSKGLYPLPALYEAAEEVFAKQTEALAIQKRIESDIRTIWALQPRLEKSNKRSTFKLLEHERFRAGYDFLLLRCEAGELDPKVGQWWTSFINATDAEKEALFELKNKVAKPEDSTKRKRRRRSFKNKPRQTRGAAAIH